MQIFSVSPISSVSLLILPLESTKNALREVARLDVPPIPYLHTPFLYLVRIALLCTRSAIIIPRAASAITRPHLSLSIAFL